LPPDSKVTLTGIEPGKYIVKFWDCQADKALPSTKGSSTDGTLTVALPSAVSDIAAALIPEK
jgi:hypothetical protein